MSLRNAMYRTPRRSCRWALFWVVLWVWCLGFSLSLAAASAVTISLTSTPASDTIRPDADMAHVTLVAQQDGHPLSHGHVVVKVTAPSRPRWLSTDFPRVEGTTLLELASDLRDGAFSFDYLFPIRGEYGFNVAVQPRFGAPHVTPTTVQKTWQLRENPTEIRNAWLLIVSLFVLGGFFGIVLARSANAKNALLFMIALASVALVIRAECNVRVQAESSPPQQVVNGAQGWTLQVDTTPAQGTVGEQVRFDIVLTKDGEVFQNETQMSIELHHIEDNQPIFKTAIYAPTGETSQQLQFFDGAPHQVMIAAQPASHVPVVQKPLQAIFQMDVQGLQPPLIVKLRTLALFIGVLTVGMVVGWFVPVKRKETDDASLY